MAHFDIGNRLAIYGWKQDTECFYDILVAEFKESGFRNVEQLLFRPTEGLKFCKNVCSVADIEVPDYEILHTLSNLRKNGYLDA